MLGLNPIGLMIRNGGFRWSQGNPDAGKPCRKMGKCTITCDHGYCIQCIVRTGRQQQCAVFSDDALPSVAIGSVWLPLVNCSITFGICILCGPI